MKTILILALLVVSFGCSSKSDSVAKTVDIGGGETSPISPQPTPSPTPTPTASVNPSGVAAVTAANYACTDGATCFDLTISCPGVANTARVVLYVKEPTVSPEKGTITFHSGGGGKGFYGSEANSQGILTAMQSSGYRTVQVKWKDAWIEGTEGLQKLACRPATAIQWVKDNLFQDIDGSQAMCSTGNSGGSVQVSSSLIWYGIALDMVLASAGPGMGDIKTGCLDPLSPLYLHDQQNIFDSTYGVSACTDKDASFTSRFEEDSLAYGVWNYNFPNTYISMVGGENDGLATNAQSELVYNRLVADSSPYLSREILAGVAHSVQQSVLGSAKIKSKLSAHCVKQGLSPVEPVFDNTCGIGVSPFFNLNGKTKISKMTNVVLAGHDHVKAKFYGSSGLLMAVIYDITHKCTDMNAILPVDTYSAEFFDMDTGETPIPVSLEDSTFKVK